MDCYLFKQDDIVRGNILPLNTIFLDHSVVKNVFYRYIYRKGVSFFVDIPDVIKEIIKEMNNPLISYLNPVPKYEAMYHYCGYSCSLPAFRRITQSAMPIDAYRSDTLFMSYIDYDKTMDAIITGINYRETNTIYAAYREICKRDPASDLHKIAHFYLMIIHLTETGAVSTSTSKIRSFAEYHFNRHKGQFTGLLDDFIMMENIRFVPTVNIFPNIPFLSTFLEGRDIYDVFIRTLHDCDSVFPLANEIFLREPSNTTEHLVIAIDLFRLLLDPLSFNSLLQQIHSNISGCLFTLRSMLPTLTDIDEIFEIQRVLSGSERYLTARDAIYIFVRFAHLMKIQHCFSLCERDVYISVIDELSTVNNVFDLIS